MATLASLVPLAADPFPPTHQAGSSFEGFFVRLQSHNGATFPSPPSLRHRAYSSSSMGSLPSPSPYRSQSMPNSSVLAYSPPVYANSSRAYTSPQHSPEAYSTGPSSTSTARTSSEPAQTPGDLIVVVCELQSAPPEQRICLYMRWIAHGEESSQTSIRLRPLKSASPLCKDEFGSGFSSVENIANGSSQNDGIANEQSKGKQRDSEDDTPEGKQDQSFEIIHYIPRWHLKTGDKVDANSVQPFRLDIPSSQHVGQELGMLEVLPNGNVHLDLTLPRAEGSMRGTRVQISTKRFVPWTTQQGGGRWREMLPLGSRGPEGLLQHLGLVLPLHWYVHTSQSPATYSIEHVALPYCPNVSTAGSSTPPARTVSSGTASVHVEKNWGHGFPTGWLWCQASSEVTQAPPDGVDSSYFPLQLGLDEGTAKSSQRETRPDDVRVSLAGGSILKLTAFLVGIHIGKHIAWDFRPPLAVGPGFAVQDGHTSWMHYGLGFKIRRDYPNKSVHIEVWDWSRWARIEISGDPATFATKIPGPCPGGWTPGYCHHSYRCRMHITLFERPLAAVPSTLISSAILNTRRSWSDIKTILRWPSTSATRLTRPQMGKQRRKARRTASMDPDPRLGDLEEESEEDELTPEAQSRLRIDQAWCNTFGWRQIGTWTLDDRVALEFGGDFAQ